MKAEAYAAFKVGVFGVILVGLCSMSLGLLCEAFSLDPIVYFASMAGVLFPAVMVMAGMLARWASEDMEGRDGAGGGVIASLTAGLVAFLGGAMLCVLTLVSPLNGFLPVDRLWTILSGPSTIRYLELVVLFTAYVAMSVIGGMLYGVIVPRSPSRH